MANEITNLIQLSVNKGSLIKSQQANLPITMNGSHYAGGAATIGTSASAIPLGSVATTGVAYFRNLDATNYVEIGVSVASVFYPLVRLKPGEAACFRVSPSQAPYAQANTANVVLEYWINED